MTTVPPKHHQPLHNFSLPFLKWGQRIQSNHHQHRRRVTPTSDLNNRGKKPHVKTEIDEQNGGVLLEAGNSSSGGKLIDVDVVTAVNGDVKPWNLRPRRFMIDTVETDTVVNKENDEEHGKKMKMEMKRRLWISLSKEEIEEDIYAFTGSRPSRRPKKRNKIAQKQLDNVFPGLYLVGISADSYRL